MGVNIYFVKNNDFSLEDIFEKTPILKHVNKDGDILLRLENNYVVPVINEESGYVMGIKKYGRNSFDGFLKILVKQFDLYFIHEYDEYEGCDGSDEFLEEYRQPMIDEINLENQLSKLLIKFKSIEALIIYILKNYKDLTK